MEKRLTGNSFSRQTSNIDGAAKSHHFTNFSLSSTGQFAICGMPEEDLIEANPGPGNSYIWR
jgi:hypothetical protein